MCCIAFWKQPRKVHNFFQELSQGILESQWHAWENAALFSAPCCTWGAVSTFCEWVREILCRQLWGGLESCWNLCFSPSFLSDPILHIFFHRLPNTHQFSHMFFFFFRMFHLRIFSSCRMLSYNDVTTSLIWCFQPLPNRLISVWWWFMMMISMLSLFRPSFFRLDFLSGQNLTSKSMKVPRREKSKPRNKITRPKHHHLSKLHSFQPLFLWEVDQILLVDTLKMHHFLKQLIHGWWSHDLWPSVVVLVQDFIERLRLLDHHSVLWSYVSRSWWWGWGVARDSEFRLHQLAVAQNLKHQNWCLEDLYI